MRRFAVTFQKKEADIWIQVDCKKIDIIGSQDDVEICFKQGYEAAKKVIAENELLKEMISAKG